MFRKEHVVAATVDGVVIGETPGTDISNEAGFSPDGVHLAWWTRRGDHASMYVDGVEQDLGGVPIGDVRFTSAGHLVCSVRTGSEAETILVDGSLGPIATRVVGSRTPQTLAARPGTSPDSAVWRVSGDSKHTAWIGELDDGMHPIVDREIGPRFEEIYSVAFDGDTATWYARSGSQMYALTARA
jgi:hypothetical protein